MDNEAISELFSGLGPVEIRRLFGGKGIYHNGVIVADRDPWRADAEGRCGKCRGLRGRRLQAVDLHRSRHGKLVSMPYWSVPDGALDDADDMKPWAREGLRGGEAGGEVGAMRVLPPRVSWGR